MVKTIPQGGPLQRGQISRAGEGSFHGVWGGVRFYFGQKDKTLIRRHREDDPTDWGAGIDGAGNTGTSTPAPAVRIVDPT